MASLTPAICKGSGVIDRAGPSNNGSDVATVPGSIEGYVLQPRDWATADLSSRSGDVKTAQYNDWEPPAPREDDPDNNEEWRRKNCGDADPVYMQVPGALDWGDEDIARYALSGREGAHFVLPRLRPSK